MTRGTEDGPSVTCADDTEQWNPRDHEPIGDCTICGEPVYPIDPTEVDADDPVMHARCGW